MVEPTGQRMVDQWATWMAVRLAGRLVRRMAVQLAMKTASLMVD